MVMRNYLQDREFPLESVMLSSAESKHDEKIGKVKLHIGAYADEYARSMHAMAFTIGTAVFFRNGAYKPETEEGRALLAHELKHVSQNKEYLTADNRTKEELEREAVQAEEIERKIEFIYGTMTGFYSVMRNLQEDYRTYAKNYSGEALELLSKSSDFIESAETVRTLDSISGIDDEGIEELMKLSEKISELYQLRPQTVKNQKGDEKLPDGSWKVYLGEGKEIAKVEYGKDRTKVQIVRGDGNASEVIDIGTEEYRKAGGFTKRLLKAAGEDA